MQFKPIATEKAVRLLDIDNTIVFSVPRKERKDAIKMEVEKIFSVKVEKIRTAISMRDNAKIVYVKLTKAYKAADLATKLGVI